MVFPPLADLHWTMYVLSICLSPNSLGKWETRIRSLGDSILQNPVFLDENIQTKTDIASKVKKTGL